jgi:glycerophosphoryl diester phosphodiesterase
MSVPRIVAHRGLHRVQPENSCEAFELALNEGFWVECDVQASAEGEAVVLHDATLDRTTSGRGECAAQPMAALAPLRLRDASGALTAARLPALGEALSKSRRDAGWLIEIKPPDARALIERVIDLLSVRGCGWVIQSFRAENVIHARSCCDSAKTALLVDRQVDLDAALNERWVAVHMHHRLATAPVVQWLRERGASVGVWTVNEPADIRRILGLGVDTIISDEPQRVRDAIEARDKGVEMG